MVHVKYIKRGGKLHGPYYYQSVRGKDGKIHKVYLGKNYQPGDEKQRQRPHLAAVLIPLLLICGLSFFVLKDVTLQSVPITGNVVFDVYRTVSAEAYMEVDGIAQPLPAKVEKQGEGEYGFNISTLNVQLSKGEHTVRILDQGEVVYEAVITIGKEQDNQGIGENATALAHNQSAEKGIGENVSVIARERKEENESYETISTNETGVQVNATVALNNSVVNETNSTFIVNISNVSVEMNGSDYDILEERTIGEVRALQKATWVRKVRVNKEKDILVELPDVARPSRAFLVEDGERYERTWEGKSVVLHKAKKDEEYEIEYETDGPFLEEVNLSAFRKRVIVGSPLNFTNVTAFTSLPKPVRKESVRLEWVDTKSVHEVESFIDTNNDSLVESIEWTVPHLSNQTFDISITVLNVYTYLRDNETWMVSFNTTGQADLIITSMQSSFTEVLQDNASTFNELVLQGLQCGEQDLLQNLWVNISSGGLVKYVSIQPTESIPVQSLVYQNYSCEGTGNLTTFVLKAGYAMLEFNFGGERTYAIDPVRVETAYPGSTVQLRAQACSKNNAGTNPLSFTATCSGTYPSMSCVAGGDRLGCDDNVIEEDASTAGPGEFSGVNASFFNATITDCLKITQVKVCHNVWFGGSDAVATANVTVARNNGVTVSLAYSTLLDLDVDPGLSCQDVTANFSWVCSDFFGPTGPRATATAQIRSGDFIGAIGKVDVLFYNVTYEAAHSVLLNSTNMLSNDTLQNLTATVTGQSADTNSYAYSWRVNGTPMEVLNLPMTDNASSSDQQTIYDFSGFNALVQLGRTPQGDTNEPLFNKTGGPDKNGAYVFDGINDFINVSHSLAISPVDAWTVDYWVYLARDPDCDGTNNWRWIYTKGDPADFQGGIFEDILEQGRTITTRFILSNRTVYGRGTTGKVEIGRWTHVVETYDSRSGRFRQYLNGTLDGEITVFPAKNMSVSTSPLYINAVNGMGAGGGCVNSNGNFNGSYANFKIYNRSLTKEQIGQNYFSGLTGYNVTVQNETFKGENWSVLVVPLNSSGWNGSLINSNGVFIQDAVPSITSVVLNSTNPDTNSTETNLTAWPRGASDPDGDAVFYNYNWYVNGTSITLFNMPMTNNASSSDGQSVWDFSGFGGHGTLGDFAQVGDPDEPIFQRENCPGGGSCYRFDGKSGKKINMSRRGQHNFSEAFSIEAWVNMSAFCNAIAQHAEAQDSGTFALYTVPQESPTLLGCSPSYNHGRFDIALINQSGVIFEHLSPPIYKQHTYHVVASYNMSHALLYVNGSLANSSFLPGFGFIQYNSTAELRLGTSEYNGTLGAVRIYNRSVSAEQVGALYQNRMNNVTVAQETFRGENWSVGVTPIDSEGWNGSTVLGNNVTITQNLPPSITHVILNSTNPLTNDTNTNLTAYPIGASDPDGNSVFYNYNWRVNGTSLTVLNLPMTNNASSSDGQTVFDFSGYNTPVTLGTPARGGTDEPKFNITGCLFSTGCYVFDGSNDFLNVSYVPSMNFSGASFTVAAWARRASSGGHHYIFGDGADGGTNIALGVGFRSTNVFTCAFYNNDLNTVATYTDTNWHHWVCTYDAVTNARKLYRDGAQVAGDTASADYVGSGNTQIGSKPVVAEPGYFNGQISHVVLYNRSLTHLQVFALYENRTDLLSFNETVKGENWSVAVTPIDSEGWNGSTVFSNNLLILDAVPSITSVILNATNVNNDTLQNLTAYPQGASDPDGDAVSYNYNWRVNSTSITLLNMPMTNNASSSDGQTTFDFSGYNIHGLLGSSTRGDTSEPTLNATGCMNNNGCYQFDGSNDYITNSTPMGHIIISNEFTLEAWVWPDDTSTFSGTGDPIIEREFGLKGMQLTFDTTNGNRFGVMTSTGSGAKMNFGAGNKNLRRWYHVVATYNGTTSAVYVNGSVENSTNFGFLVDNTLDINIGAWNLRPNSRSRFFKGIIDEVRVYNRSLTGEEIAVLYANNGQNVTVAQETVKGENWSVGVTPIDSEGWNGSTVYSNNILIMDATPTITSVILNATHVNNDTNQNLTAYPQGASDPDGDTILYNYNWRVNGTSLAVLNLPMTNNASSADGQTVFDFSGYRSAGQLGSMVRGDGNEPHFTTVGCASQDGCYFFDNFFEHINMSTKPQFNITNEITIEAWVNLTGSFADRAIVSRCITPSSVCSYEIGFPVSVSSRVEFILMNATGNRTQLATAANAVEQNRIVHLVATRNASTMSIYINGSLAASSLAFSGAIQTNNSVDLFIGQDSDLSQPWHGTIDDVRIYNRSLSALQVWQNYQVGVNSTVATETVKGENWSVAVTPIDSEGWNGSTSYSNNLLILDASPSITSVVLNSTNPNTNDTQQNLTAYPIGAGDADGDTVSYNYNWYMNGTSLAVLNMPMTNNASSSNGQTVFDFSGYNRFGRLGENGTGDSAEPVFNASCISGGCYTFDGSNDFIVVNHSLDLLPLNFSISVWMMPMSTAVQWARVLEKDGFTPGGGYSLEYNPGGNQKLLFNFFTPLVSVTTDNTLPLNKWTHIVATYDGATMRLYVNGTLQANTATATLVRNRATNFTIGKLNLGNGNYFKGNIDELVLFNRTLSAQDIFALYQNVVKNITVAQETVKGENWSVAVTPIDSEGWNGSTVSSNNVSIVNSPPQNVTLITPVNGSYWANGRMFLNWTEAVDNDTDSFTYFLFVNGSNVNATNALNITHSLPEGYFDWTILVGDGEANSSFAFNRTFIVDTTRPRGGYLAPTPAHEERLLADTISVNVTIFDRNLENITFWLFNTTSIVNQTFYLLTGNVSNVSINFTGLNRAVHRYFYNVSIFDKAGNLNVTQTRGVTLNLPPTITTVIVNSTNIATNDTLQNLTAFVEGASDVGEDNVTLNYNWLINGTPIALVNLPMTDASYSNDNQTVFDFSGYNYYGTLGRYATGDNAEPLFTRVGCGFWNRCYKFDGSNDFINLSRKPGFNISDEITIEAWFNSTGSGSLTLRLLTRCINTAGACSYLTGVIPSTSTGQVALKNTTGQFLNLYSTGTVRANQLVHLVATYNGTVTSLYVNGSLTDASTNLSGPLETANTLETIIGARPDLDPSLFFKGQIAEMRVYNRSLSAEQVRQNYLLGNGGYNVTVSQEVFKNENWSVGVTPIDSEGVNGTTVFSNNLLILDAPPSITSVILNSTNPLADDTNQNLTAYPIGTSDPDSDTVSYNYNWRVNSNSIAVLNMPMTNNASSSDGQTTFDFSGYNNFGRLATLSGTLNTESLPIFNTTTCISQDGCYQFIKNNNQTINISFAQSLNMTRMTNGFTITAWVYSLSAGTNEGFFRQDDGGTMRGFNIAIRNNANTLQFALWNTSGHLQPLGTNNTRFLRGQWMHVAAVYNTTHTLLYINGTEGNSQVFTGMPRGTGYRFIIGSVAGGGVAGNWLGNIDELVWYNRTLSTEQINTLYEQRTHNLTISQETFEGENWSVGVTPIDSEGWNGSTVFSNDMLILNSPPENVTLTTPANNTFFLTNSVFLNWTSGIDNDSDGLTYFLFVNGINQNATTALNMTMVLADGFYDWTILVSDGQANSSFAFNSTFTVDTTQPQVMYVAPTENNGASRLTNAISVNVSIYDVHPLQNITFWLFNRTGILNQTFYTLSDNMTNVSINFTSLNVSAHVFKYNVTVYDTAGNLNTTETRTITLNTPPTLSSVILNATNVNNNTIQNLTVYPIGGADVDADNVTYTYNWNVNGTSITVLNLEMTNANYSADGKTTFDFSGYDNNAHLGNATVSHQGDPEFRTGKFCPNGRGCYYYDGRGDDYINVTVNAVLNSTINSFSVEAWANETNINNNRYIVSRSSGVSFGTFYLKINPGSSSFAFGVWNRTGMLKAATGSRKIDSRVFHVVGTYNGSLVSLYVNGSLVATQNHTGLVAMNNSLPIMIGNDPTGGFFLGTIGAVRIYNLSLSAEEVGALYKNSDNNVTVSQETFKYENWSVAVTPIDSEGVNGTTVFSNNMAIVNTVPENLTLTIPVNNSFFNYNTIFFNWTRANDNDTDQLTYFLFVNGTNVNATTALNITHSLQEGVFDWTILSGDGQANSSSFATNRTFTIDTTQVRGVYVAPTENDSVKRLTNTISVNVSLYEVNPLQNITFWLFNRTGVVNQTFYSLSNNLTNVSINFTNVNTSVHTFTYNVTIYDVAGNLNTTETRTITLDTAPTLSSVILNATNVNNNIIQNLTVYPIGGADVEGDNVTYNYNWYVNGTSIAVLNMPMTDAGYSSDNQTVFDFSGQNNYGTLGTSVRGDAREPIFTTIGCPLGQGCYQFDGINDAINFSTRAVHNITEEITMEAWVNVTAISTNRMQILGRCDSGLFNCPYSIQLRPVGKVLSFISNETASASFDSTTTLSLDTIYHLVVTYNGSRVILYINGVQDNSAALYGFLKTNNSRSFIIGAFGLNNGGIDTIGNFSGLINNVHIYNRSLTAQQIAQNYFAGAGGYNTTVSQETFKGENWSVGVTPIDHLGVNGTTVVSNNITILNSPPENTTLTMPANNTFFNYNNIFLNWTAGNDNDTDLLTYFLYLNGTLSNGTTSLNVTQVLPEGYYEWSILVGDGQVNSSTFSNNRTFTVDMTPPRTLFIDPTLTNNSFRSQTFVTVNVSVYDLRRLQNISFMLFNRTGILNQTLYWLANNATNVSINISNVNTTTHMFMYNVSVYDFAGNLNVSETRLITLNLPPSIQQVVLSATSLSNNTEQNLTAYPAEMMGTSDPEGDNVTSNYNWLINRSSMTGLNLPMTNAQYSSTTQTTFDFSGHGAHGILGTAVAGDGAEPVFNQSCGIDGEGNGCYQFNGSQYINVSKVASLNLTIVLGVEAWVYPESIEKNNGIVDWTDAGATNGSYMLFVEDGVAKFRLVRQDSTVLTISSDVVMPVRRWTHLVGVYNRTHMGLYVNGTLQRDVAAITSVRNVNGPLLIGTLGMDASGFNGSLDDVKVYNASLSRAQVEQNYFRGFSGYNITVGEQTAKLDIWTTHVTPIDHLGLNGTSTVSNSIRIENTMPANVSLIAPANGSYVNTDLVFMNWTASNDSDGDAIIYYLFVNGVNVNATVEPNITHFLADGVYDWTVSADDTLQNTSFAQNQSFTVDTTLPDVAVTSSAGTAFTVGTATTITCSATDVNSFEVRLTGDAACVGAMACSASFSPASSGTKTVTCTGTDLAGNSMVKILSMDVTSPGGGGGSSGGGGGGAPGIPLTVKVGDNGEIVAQIGNKTEIKVKFSIDNETGILKPSVDVNFKVDDTEREVKGVDVMYIPAWMYGLALLALAVGTTMASMGGEVRKLTQEQWQVFRTTLSGERKRMVQFQKVGPLVLKPQWERGYGRLKANEVYRLPEAKQLAALEEEVKRVRKLLRTTKVDISPVLKMDVPERMIRREQPRMAEQEFYAYELLNEIEVLELLVVEKEWKVAKQVLESTQRLFETYAPYLEGKYKGDIQKRLGIIREMLKKTKA